MPCSFIRFLANSLLPSSRAAKREGPKAGIPSSSMASAMPSTRGSSGAITARPTFFSLARATMPWMSVAFTSAVSASAAMPPFPGAQMMRPQEGLSLSFLMSACSRPPEPTTSISMVFLPSFLLSLSFPPQAPAAPSLPQGQKNPQGEGAACPFPDAPCLF